MNAKRVAAIGNGLEGLGLQHSLRLLSHFGRLRSIRATVRYFVRDNQMMLGIDGDLHVVAHDAGPAAARGHRSAVGIAQGYVVPTSGRERRTSVLKFSVISEKGLFQHYPLACRTRGGRFEKFHKQTQAPLRTEAVYESRNRAPRSQRCKGRIASRSMLQCFYKCIAKSLAR